jgi:hypothetical protein
MGREEAETRELIRRYRYDLDGGAAEMGDVTGVQEEEFYLRVIDSTRLDSRLFHATPQRNPLRFE